MATLLTGPRPARTGDELTRSLLDCHERIRRFSELAVRLAEAEPAGTPDALAQIREAAAGVHRYFTIALPLHSADEERSVEPRLSALRPELAETFAKMAREHRMIEALLDELSPRWSRLIEAPERQGEEAKALRAPSSRLRELFAGHLPPEEQEVFPALAALSPAERAAILEELRARRRP